MLFSKLLIKERGLIMMKKIFALLLAGIMLAAFSACFKKELPPEPETSVSQPEPEASEPGPPPDPKTPDGAVSILLDDIRDWDDSVIEKALTDAFPSSEFPQAFADVFKPIAERLEYEVGNSKVEGDNAVVDLSVTAADAKSAVNGALAGGAAYVAIKRAGGDERSPEELFAEYMTNNINWDDTPTIKTDTTVYLVKGADDEWKVDADNPENMPFLNALSGGAVDLVDDLKSLAGQFA